ncbi:MAG: Rieske 2Fe-2S domain-containing protein [Desulfobacterales bacterium]|nr:Rieske 2Fe-2S domain-containing protein [Desulfobacterales bacterium]
MSNGQGNKRKVEIYRYDPTQGGDGHFDHFDLYIEDETNTTILDVLIRIQKEQDSTLAFRYACRVNMCGSCAMVINGREGLACKTNVSDFSKNQALTIRPLNHFPVVKDLVVDMDPFFKNYEECLPFFEPREILEEPAVIRPDSRERQAIGLATECIACGCCVSSCTMANYHEGYAGPAPLNRAFTLLMDSRDALYEARMDRVLQSCYNCRTEFNCTEVCPKEISCTRSIKYIQRLAVKEPFRATSRLAPDAGVQPADTPIEAVNNVIREDHDQENHDIGRRRFLTRMTLGIGGVSALTVGGVLASAFIGPALDKKPAQWIPAGKIEDFPIGSVSTAHLRYKEKIAFYQQDLVKPVMIWRQPNENKIVVYSSSCTHLGCTVHWDASQNMFLCACHGGAFGIDGTVKAGPPPRPLDQLAFRVDSGNLLIEMV